jgi:2-phosphoglycerate kinase
VLLVGGSSGVGKTMISERVARQLGIPWNQADDFYQALHDMSTPADQPALHFFDDDAIWEMPPELLCERFVETAQAVSHSLDSVIAHHIATASPVVLEGIWIVPALAAQTSFGGTPCGGQVRSVFLIELDERSTLDNTPGNTRWFDRRAAAVRRARARVSLLYSQWLESEAARYKIPVVTVRPWPTLPERILTAIG